jgi:hypothetical protein
LFVFQEKNCGGSASACGVLRFVGHGGAHAAPCCLKSFKVVVD